MLPVGRPASGTAAVWGENQISRPRGLGTAVFPISAFSRARLLVKENVLFCLLSSLPTCPVCCRRGRTRGCPHKADPCLPQMTPGAQGLHGTVGLAGPRLAEGTVLEIENPSCPAGGVAGGQLVGLEGPRGDSRPGLRRTLSRMETGRSRVCVGPQGGQRGRPGDGQG